MAFLGSYDGQAWRGDAMSEASAVALNPETVLARMKQNGITDVVWLPDSETKPLEGLAQP